MANFSIENFRSTVSTLGLARKNRFEVDIAIPLSLQQAVGIDQKTVSLLAESAVFPELTINADLQQIWGPAIHRPKNINYGGFMVVQFLLDQKMQVKRFFDTWMQNIVDDRQYTVSYQRDYVSPSITVTQLDETNNVAYGITLTEGFPAGQVQLDVSHSLNDTFHLHSVNFRFRRWYENNPKKSSTLFKNSLDKNSLVPQEPVKNIGNGAFKLLPRP